MSKVIKEKVHVVGCDVRLSLKSLALKVAEWIETYGEDAKFLTDAGYNNCDLLIDNRVKTTDRSQ